MKIKPFHTERFFAIHEFTAPYLLCASDCESLTVDELLQLAGVSYASLGRLWLGYTESQGAPALRERIAGLYTSVGADQVVGLGAPEEGILITMHALLEPGDEVVALTPCYDSLTNVVEYLGCRVARWVLAGRSRTIVQDNLGLAEPFFARWQKVFRWNRPMAGSVALVGLRSQSARGLSDSLAAELGVLLLPGTGLGSDDRHVRFGFGRRNFRAGLERLDRYLAT